MSYSMGLYLDIDSDLTCRIYSSRFDGHIRFRGSTEEFRMYLVGYFTFYLFA